MTIKTMPVYLQKLDVEKNNCGNVERGKQVGMEEKTNRKHNYIPELVSNEQFYRNWEIIRRFNTYGKYKSNYRDPEKEYIELKDYLKNVDIVAQGD